MKFYKTWWKKFAADYENLKPDKLGSSELDGQLELESVSLSDTETYQSRTLGTELTRPYPQLLMLLFLCIAAGMIVWHLYLPKIYKYLSIAVILANVIYDIYGFRLTQTSLISLHKVGDDWRVQTQAGVMHKAQLLAVSSILGTGYCLEIRVEDRLKSEFYCIWKLKSNQAFYSYCTQLRKIGFND